MIITIRPLSSNATPEVIRALAALNATGGGELHFETGEYHFYKEGTKNEFFAVSNNSANVKAMVFPITDMENITVDRHGSEFVFESDEPVSFTLDGEFGGSGRKNVIKVLKKAITVNGSL